MTPIITAFKSSPDRGKGQARDMRVRWAFEEVGQPYDVRLVSFKEMKEPAHRALHPFGQIPTYEDGDLALFESGAIVFQIAQRHAGLLPDDVNARARAITWMFAALSTVEPPIVDRGVAMLLERDQTWHEQRLPMVDERIRVRLGELSARLGEVDWLDGAFSTGDLMMVTVLRRLNTSSLLDEFPTWPRMSHVAKRGRRSSVLSMLNWRFSPRHRRAADEGAVAQLHSGCLRPPERLISGGWPSLPAPRIKSRCHSGKAAQSQVRGGRYSKPCDPLLVWGQFAFRLYQIAGRRVASC
jgi:glutathione S-transferase